MAVTLSELQTMVEKASEPGAKSARVWRIVMNFRIVDFDEEAARRAGRIRARLEPRGMNIGPLDTLIAAHALAHRAILVTDNVREFGRVDGLKLENWIKGARES
jgi:tRNA(fMet)-specific endonuclease VapC